MQSVRTVSDRFFRDSSIFYGSSARKIRPAEKGVPGLRATVYLAQKVG
jgi:hypothetical protein